MNTRFLQNIALFLIIGTFGSCLNEREELIMSEQDLTNFYETRIEAALENSDSYGQEQLIQLQKITKFKNYASQLIDTCNALKEKGVNDYTNLFATNQLRLKSPDCFSSQMTNFEKSIYTILNEKMLYRSVWDKAIILNETSNFLYESMCDDHKRDRLLYLIACMEITTLNSINSIFKQNEISLKSGIRHNDLIQLKKGRAFERCYDKCMDGTFSDMNPVDWIQFALNPPAYVAWHAASCVYDCATDRK